MRKEGKQNSNQHYYTKRLNTESFGEPLLREELGNLAAKIEKQIQVVKRNLRVKNLKMFKAKHKLTTIQKEQQQMRETLRSKIDSRIKLSQSNLQSIMLGRTSQSRSKSKFRQTTIDKIKDKEKKSIQQAFRKSQLYRKESEKYLNCKHNNSPVSQSTSYTQLIHKTRYPSSNSTKYDSFSHLQARRKVLPHVLKVTQSVIVDIQSRKNHFQQKKEMKNICSYIEKLQNIEDKRKVKVSKLDQTIKIRERKRQNERQKVEQRKQTLSMSEKTNKRDSRGSNRVPGVQRHSFSQIYAKNLQKKLNKKGLIEMQSFQQGSQIIAQEHAYRGKKKNHRLLSQTLKDVQRKVSFKYREKLFH